MPMPNLHLRQAVVSVHHSTEKYYLSTLSLAVNPIIVAHQHPHEFYHFLVAKISRNRRLYSSSRMRLQLATHYLCSSVPGRRSVLQNRNSNFYLSLLRCANLLQWVFPLWREWRYLSYLWEIFPFAGASHQCQMSVPAFVPERRAALACTLRPSKTRQRRNNLTSVTDSRQRPTLIARLSYFSCTRELCSTHCR